MEAFVFLVSLVTLGYVVIVYRSLSHPEIHLHSWSAEYREAQPRSEHGITASQRDDVTRASAPGHVVGEVDGAMTAAPPVLTPAGLVPALSCPTLDMIDRALGPAHAPFAIDPAAGTLEERARDLADLYWSDFVWLTGHIDGARLAVVAAALDRERAGMPAMNDSLPAA